MRPVLPREQGPGAGALSQRLQIVPLVPEDHVDRVPIDQRVEPNGEEQERQRSCAQTAVTAQGRDDRAHLADSFSIVRRTSSSSARNSAHSWAMRRARVWELDKAMVNESTLSARYTMAKAKSAFAGTCTAMARATVSRKRG